MKLWLLSINVHAGYDTYDSFVIRAESDEDARTLASKCRGYEGPDVWLDWSASTCEHLGDEGEPGVVISSFNAG